jgi:hypothetical protein
MVAALVETVRQRRMAAHAGNGEAIAFGHTDDLFKVIGPRPKFNGGVADFGGGTN